MDRPSIEAIEDSLDLPIGTKFYFRNNLFEVVEFKEGIWGCPGCAFSISKRNEEEMCNIMECTDSRRDGKTVCFKEVVKAEEEKMATIIICDRCGVEIKTTTIKRVSFKPDYGSAREYDVCEECYDELQECMKTKKEKKNA